MTLKPQDYGIVLGLSGDGGGTNISGNLIGTYVAGVETSLFDHASQGFWVALGMAASGLVSITLKIESKYPGPLVADSSFDYLPSSCYSQRQAGYSSEFTWTKAVDSGGILVRQDLLSPSPAMKAGGLVKVSAYCTGNGPFTSADFIKVGLTGG